MTTPWLGHENLCCRQWSVFCDCDVPICTLCDAPVEVLPSGVLVHPNGEGHEVFPS